jgi:hypothetical protein
MLSSPRFCSSNVDYMRGNLSNMPAGRYMFDQISRLPTNDDVMRFHVGEFCHTTHLVDLAPFALSLRCNYISPLVSLGCILLLTRRRDQQDLGLCVRFANQICRGCPVYPSCASPWAYKPCSTGQHGPYEWAAPYIKIYSSLCVFSCRYESKRRQALSLPVM